MYRDPDGHTDLVQSGREPDGEHDRINDHLVQFPPDAVIPLEQVRDALLEFQRTGSRPTCVQWQVIEAVY